MANFCWDGVVDDVARMRRALAGVETVADAQHWARQRPWRTKTHVFWEGELPTLDGHDLGAKAMKVALRALIDVAPELETGAVRIVTGRGRHSLRAGPVLPQIVEGVLGREVRAHGGALQPHGAATWVWVWDPARAPASAVATTGCGLTLLYVGFAAAAVAALGHQLGWW